MCVMIIISWLDVNDITFINTIKVFHPPVKSRAHTPVEGTLPKLCVQRGQSIGDSLRVLNGHLNRRAFKRGSPGKMSSVGANAESSHYFLRYRLVRKEGTQ